MIKLSDVTFIIPVSIESPDRHINAQVSLAYLCKNFNTNIIIYEYDISAKIPAILSDIETTGTNIKHVFENSENNSVFHRTKFLNKMLLMTETPIVVNYDVDILLKPETYIECADMIRNGFDLVYPYFIGNSQWQVYNEGRDVIAKTLDLKTLPPKTARICRSEYGQCQFFNTINYIKGGMENEGFVSYAPEDQERAYRFKKLGYMVTWTNNFIYHMEHFRGPNSSSANPMMGINDNLFKQIKRMSVDELREYYDNILKRLS